MPFLFKKYIFVLLVVNCFLINGQEPKTIKVRKESDLVKAYFDPSEMKLMAIDRFGNPRDNQIASFKLYVKTKRDGKAFESFNGQLNAEMIGYLNKLKDAAKIFFTNILVKDDKEQLINLPDVIDVWFPTANNSNKKNRR